MRESRVEMGVYYYMDFISEHITIWISFWDFRRQEDSSQFNATLDQFAKQMQDMVAHIIALLQKQKLETYDSTINSGEVTNETPTKVSTSDE